MTAGPSVRNRPKETHVRSNRPFSLLAVLALVAVLLFVFWHLRAVAVPLFVALLFSTLLLPLTRRRVAWREPAEPPPFAGRA